MESAKYANQISASTDISGINHQKKTVRSQSALHRDLDHNLQRQLNHEENCYETIGLPEFTQAQNCMCKL